jgi:hypothetical protein
MNGGSVRICCDCKYNESVVYEQIKCYIEEKVSTLQELLMSRISNIDILKEEFNNYRQDMIRNLDFIIYNLKNEMTSDACMSQIDYKE